MTEFIRSYTPAMRSNIAWTWGSGRVPAVGMPALTALEGPQVVHEVLELLRVLVPQRGEGRHRRRRVDQRAGDRGPGEAVTDVREVGPGAGVAVLPDAVAAEAAGGGGHVLAALVVGGRLLVDLRWRPGDRALERPVEHRDDRRDAGERGDRAPQRMPLRVAVDERQQDQEDHADRRDPDRRQEHERRRLDHAQELEEEEEVPLGPWRVGRRGRVRLGAELRAEDQ